MRFSLLLFSLFLLSTTSVDDLNSARVYFQSGRESKSSAEKLLKLTQGKESAILKAYNGGATAILAKHQSNPLKKLDYLKKGLIIINNAVLLDAADIAKLLPWRQSRKQLARRRLHETGHARECPLQSKALHQGRVKWKAA